ncbi:MAG: phosphatidylglycerol lysyltransferase domain-containing protein [bacterium]
MSSDSTPGVDTPHFVVLLPTLLLVVGLTAVAVLRHRAPVRRLVLRGGDWVTAIVPRALALLTFVAGAVLLFSGAVPTPSGRLGTLQEHVPLAVVELSAYLARAAGAGLIVLARGIQRRLDAAYHLTTILLVSGVVFSLGGALDVEQAISLTVMIVALVASRRYFTRHASLFDERFTRGWLVAIACVIGGTLVLAYVWYRDIGLSGRHFFQFSHDADAPRSLRALTGAAGVLIVWAMARLVRPARVSIPLAAPAELQHAAEVVATSRRAGAHLALLGDKSILFDATGCAFLMYRVVGQSWIALGDPVGDPACAIALIERFIEMADKAGGWTAFYRAGPSLLPIYLEFGLSVVKLGEVARVPLATWTLEGPDRRTLRRVHRKLARDGLTFEIVEPAHVHELVPQLSAISDDWLLRKQAHEKAFSLGRFDERFLALGRVGVARLNGKLVAFASVWTSAEHVEAEVDLMRYDAAAPPAVMRFLLTELIFWAQREGFEWFNLGMVPLAGIRRSVAAPMWHQVTSLFKRAGERYYNFEGLRDFKQWFHPEWEPSYLVSVGGTKRPITIANIASLISAGPVAAPVPTAHGED